MHINVKRRLPGQGCGVNVEKAWGTDNPFLTSLVRPVNHLILFRCVAVNGLGLAGGWCERLTLWIPLVDMTAKLLRAVAEGRI